jgi:hypothetical protein
MNQTPTRAPKVAVRNIEEGKPPIMVPAFLLGGHPKGRRAAFKDDISCSYKGKIADPGAPGSVSFDFWQPSRYRQDDLTYRTGGEQCGAGHLIPWVASGRNRQGKSVLQAIVIELPNGAGFHYWTRSKRQVYCVAFWSIPWTAEVEHGCPLAFLSKHLGDAGAAEWLARPYPPDRPRLTKHFRVAPDHPTVAEWHRIDAARLKPPTKVVDITLAS